MWLSVRLAPWGARQKNTLYWCASKAIQKNSKRDTIKVFKPIVKRKEKIWHKRDIVYHIQSGCVNITRLCSYKCVEIIEGHLMRDHVHMLVSIPPRISVSSFIGYLKGKSALMMFDKHANLKYKFGNRHFWANGYYVSTVEFNEATIKKYIQD